MMEEILADEEGHADELNDLLGNWDLSDPPLVDLAWCPGFSPEGVRSAVRMTLTGSR